MPCASSPSRASRRRASGGEVRASSATSSQRASSSQGWFSRVRHQQRSRGRAAVTARSASSLLRTASVAGLAPRGTLARVGRLLSRAPQRANRPGCCRGASRPRDRGSTLNLGSKPGPWSLPAALLQALGVGNSWRRSAFTYVGHRRWSHQALQARLQGGHLLLGCLRPAAPLLLSRSDQHVEQGPRPGLQDGLHGAGAMLADEVVGVEAGARVRKANCKL